MTTTQLTYTEEDFAQHGWIGRGCYFVPDVARLLGVSPSMVRGWVLRGLAGDAVNLNLHGHNRIILDFDDLITLRVVHRLREEKGFSLQRIRSAHDRWSDRLSNPHPFATNKVWADEADFVLDEADTHMESGTKPNQFVIPEIARTLLQDVTFDEASGRALQWHPVRTVALDPAVQLGTPCVNGTRVPARTITAMVNAGDPVNLIARDFELHPNEVREAAEWYNRAFVEAA